MKRKCFFFVLVLIYLFASVSVLSVGIPEVIQIKVQIDNKIAKVNDKDVTMEAPPMIIKNRTFVPLRFISDAFGANIGWDAASQTVFINMDNPAFLRNETMEQETEIKRLNELLKIKDESIKSLTEEIKKKNGEIDSLKEENSKLKQDILALQSEIENLKKSINTDIEYKNIQVFVNGKKIYTKLEPFLLKGKVFASLEDICKPLGKKFKWDSLKNIFYIEEVSEGEQPAQDVPEKIGIYTNSFGYYIYVADPIKNRVIKYSTDGLYLDTIIKTVSTHTSGEKWELKKVVDVVTCRLTDVIGVADAITGYSYIYEISGHTHHKNGRLGYGEGELQELWGVAMTETNETKSQALLDRKGCKISHWNPPPGGIKDPRDGLWDMDVGEKGTGDGQLMYPEGICYDKKQNLWVADTGNSRVVEFDFRGRFVRNLMDDFEEPCAVGVDFLSSQGDKLYVLDRGTKTIHVFSSSRERIKLIHLDVMERPSSMTIDMDNNIWVTDIYQNKAYKYNQEGAQLLVVDNLITPAEVKRDIVRVFVGKYIMNINDKIKANDDPPFEEDGQTYVPVLRVSEGFGAKITSDDGEDHLIVEFKDRIVELWKGKKKALVNSVEVSLDSPPILRRYRLFITYADYGKLFPVSVSYNPRDVRYSAASISFIHPK